MMKKKITGKTVFNEIKNIVHASVGCLLYAAAISLFLDPNKLAPGGVSGMAIMISELVPVLKTGLVTLILNIPLIIIGLIKLSKRFMIYTAYSTVLSSVLIDVLLKTDNIIRVPLTDNTILASLAGGALLGVGIGMLILAGGSSGGSDIIIRIMRTKYKHIKTGGFYLICDSVLIALSALVFRDVDVALAAGISLVVSSFVLDTVLYGRYQTKLLLIISSRADEIAKRLMSELETGVTYLEGRGAYTNEDKDVIMCAIKKHHFTKMREIVRDTDKNAFMIVTSASEIFGEGYKEHFGEDV